MVSFTEDHYLIHGQNVYLLKKAIIYSEKSMKGYVGLMKLKIPKSGRHYCKVTTGPVCQKMYFSSYKNVLSVNSLLVLPISLPTFSIQLKVHGLLLFGEWIS